MGIFLTLVSFVFQRQATFLPWSLHTPTGPPSFVCGSLSFPHLSNLWVASLSWPVAVVFSGLLHSPCVLVADYHSESPQGNNKLTITQLLPNNDTGSTIQKVNIKEGVPTWDDWKIMVPKSIVLLQSTSSQLITPKCTLFPQRGNQRC